MQRFNQFILKYISNESAIYFVFFALLVILINSLKIKYSDFETYYFSAIMSHDPAYKYLIFQPSELCSYVKNELHIDGFYGGFTHPPNISLYYSLFIKLDFFYAKIINNLLSIFLFVLSLKRLFTYYKIEFKWLFLIPFIFYFPLRSNIYFGQFYLILFSLLVESLLALELKKYNLSAFLLSLAIFTKIFPVLLIIYLLIAHPIKVSLKVMLYTTILFAIAVVMQGFDIWKLYVLEIFPRLNYGELHASFSYYFQTFFLFFKMMFVYDELRNPLALYDNYNLFLVSVIFVKAFLMIFTVASTMKNIKNNLYNFSLWLLCALLLLPNSNTYTMIFLMFIFFYYIHKYKHQPYIFISLLCIVFYISWVPTFKMMHMPYILRYSKLIFTFLLFIVLIKNEGILIRLKETMAIFLFVIGSSINLLFKERTIKSSYLITKNRPELISQLYLKNNKLNYAYWNLNGEIHDSTDIVSTVKPNDKIELINNQLVLNSKLITQSKDLKKSPLIIGQKIYYLSDLNQGYGFYTIRMLDFVPTN
jgi:hypothetical protein